MRSREDPDTGGGQWRDAEPERREWPLQVFAELFERASEPDERASELEPEPEPGQSLGGAGPSLRGVSAEAEAAGIEWVPMYREEDWASGGE